MNKLLVSVQFLQSTNRTGWHATLLEHLFRLEEILLFRPEDYLNVQFVLMRQATTWHGEALIAQKFGPLHHGAQGLPLLIDNGSNSDPAVCAGRRIDAVGRIIQVVVAVPTLSPAVDRIVQQSRSQEMQRRFCL